MIPLAVAALIAASLVYFAPILSDPVTHVAGGAGDPLLVGYVVTWVAEHLWTPEAWNPPFFHPVSNVLAYSDHLYGLGVTIAPALAAGVPVTLIVNGIAWAAFALTSVALLVWLMDAPRGRWPACAAAITVTYCGWFTQQLSHPHLIFLPYLPLSLLCIDRALARRGPLWLLAVAAGLLSLQTLSVTSLAVFLLPSVGVYIVAWLLFERAGRRMWIASGAALLAVATLNLPMARHYWMLGSGFERSPVEIARHSATWIDWISAPATHWLYGERLAFTVGEERELYPGIGLFALAFTGAALALASRLSTRTRTWSGLIVAALALWAATGPSTRGFSISHLPYDLLTALVPGAENVRVPARFVILAAIFLAPAIAEAWRAVFAWLERRLVLRPAAIVVGALLVVAVAAEGLAGFARHERVTYLATAIPPRELKSGAALFLPLSAPGGEIRRMWHARNSGVPVVNGYSGHQSYLWETVRQLEGAQLPDDVHRLFYTRLLAAGVDTVIVEGPGSSLASDRYLQPLGQSTFRIINAPIAPLPRTMPLGSGAGLLIPEIGWSYPEQSDTESWVWMHNRRAEMSVPMDGSPVRALELRVRALRNESPLELFWNGRSLGTRTVSSNPSVVRFDLPAEATGAGWMRFAIEGPEPVPVPASEDPRRLSVCVYEIALR